MSGKRSQPETVVQVRRKIASSDDGRRYMVGDRHRKATALPRRSTKGRLNTISRTALEWQWVGRGSVTSKANEVEQLLGAKALAKEEEREIFRSSSYDLP